MVSINNDRFVPLPISTRSVFEKPNPRDTIIDLLKQLEYIKKQLKQLLDT